MARALSQIEPVGFNLDLPAFQVPVEQWTGGINVHSRDGIPERIQGYTDIFGNPLGPPMWLFSQLTETTAFWLYGTGPALLDQGLFVTDGVGHFDISPATGVDFGVKKNPFTGTDFNSIAVINWGDGDDPVFWDGVTGNPTTVLPGWPPNTSVEAMRGFQNYLIGMDVTDSGSRIENLIIWSDAAPPGSLPGEWIPSPSNQAGFRSLAATPGPVVDGIPLRNQFLLFKHNSTYSLDLIGGTFVFALRKLFLTTGVLSRNCAAEFFGRVVCFTDGDITLTDGHSVDSLIDRRMRRFIFSQIDSDNFLNSFVANYSARREIWFCFPTSGSEFADLAAVWDYEQDKWTVRELFNTPFGSQGVVNLAGAATDWDSDPNAWDTDTTDWNESTFNPVNDNLVLADNVRGFTNVDAGTDLANGQSINALFQRDSLDFGEPLKVKTVRSIWARISGITGDIVRIRVGSQFDTDDPITWSAPVDFEIGVDVKVDTFASGRLLSFQFASTGGAPWIHSGFAVEFGTLGSLY